jgi:hypothetical protein
MTGTAVALQRPIVRAEWIAEPELFFGESHTDVNPKIGLTMWGARSKGTTRHPSAIRVGLIGPADAVTNVERYLNESALGVDGDDDNQPFAGLSDVYGTSLVTGVDLTEKITRHELADLERTTPARNRFEKLVGLIDSKLELLAGDHPPAVVMIVFDDDLYASCRAVDYRENRVFYHRDLRRAIKAVAMRHRLPTQLFRDSTTRLVPTKRSLDHPAEVAWNLWNGLFFKAGGLPWSPSGLQPGSCYIGISFYRPLGEKSTLVSSVVQAFDDQGDGLVLRGHDFRWDEDARGRSPHLPDDAAHALIEMVLERYASERKQTPRRVVVHKSSWYEPEELQGFQSALAGVPEFDLLALRATSDWRLLRFGKYPPLRGTVLSAGEQSMLYTNGWVPELGYDHGHVPSPLEITDHRGDTSRMELLREVLVLTKMNWNSTAFCESNPITLRFSRQVGEILQEVPRDEVPRPQYAYYM